MPQFNFFGTWNDSWKIIATIFAEGDYSLVPDLRYEKPEPLFYNALDDSLKEMLVARGNGFLWSAKFSRFPPIMARINGGELDGSYYVNLVEGGPYLRLNLPGCYEHDHIIQLGSGFLQLPNWTTAPGSNIAIKPSPELRAAYKEVQAIIKHHLVRLKTGLIRWCGQEAAHLLAENRAKL